MIAAVFGNARAADILHHNVGLSIRADSSVEQARDIGMVQRSQYLALSAQPAQKFLAAETGLHQLDCDLLGKLSVIAFRAIDRAHAAFANELQELIRTELRADQAVGPVVGKALGKTMNCRTLNESTGLTVGLKQRRNFCMERRIIAATLLDVVLLALFRQLDRAGKYVLYLMPAISLHASALFDMSW